MQKKFLWVKFFHQVEKIFNYFQNHTARMIFCKICLKVKKNTKDFPVNWTQIKFKGDSLIFFLRGPINLLEIFHLNLKAISIFCWTIILLRLIFQESKVKGIFFFLGFVFILFKLKEGTPPYPRAAGPRAWRDAWGFFKLKANSNLCWTFFGPIQFKDNCHIKLKVIF